MQIIIIVIIITIIWYLNMYAKGHEGNEERADSCHREGHSACLLFWE